MSVSLYINKFSVNAIFKGMKLKIALISLPAHFPLFAACSLLTWREEEI